MDLGLDYGYERLTTVPPEMEKWGVWLEEFDPTSYGEYVLVGLEPADIEGAHQAIVLDENGRPMNGVFVIFGFPGGGPDIPLNPRRNFWRGSPRVLKGNYVATRLGYAEHTYEQGGEDIWVWDLNRDGELRYSSAIVRNCRWRQDRFIHTGVKLTFQRRDSAIVPEGMRLAQLEARVARLERALDDLTPGSLADVMNREQPGDEPETAGNG